MKKKLKQPWPTKDVMTQIYEQHLWGGEDYDFYSGEGSHNTTIVEPYIKAVANFLKFHDNQLSVCDLGCGDFNIGKQLASYTKHYIGIDIVEQLIERNKCEFKSEDIEFYCLDISIDKLPKSDCVILRQVLQHLSNGEIMNVIKNIKHYKYLILTEHIPLGNFIPNKDVISGQGIRLKNNSGVDLLHEPFNLKIQKYELLNTVIIGEKLGQIVTSVYTL